ADAWILGVGRSLRRQAFLPTLRSRLVGCDTMEPDQAFARVRWWVEQLHAEAAVPVAGVLRTAEELGGRIETLYFDGSSDEDWPAFAIRDDTEYLLLDREHVFCPEPHGTHREPRQGPGCAAR